MKENVHNTIHDSFFPRRKQMNKMKPFKTYVIQHDRNKKKVKGEGKYRCELVTNFPPSLFFSYYIN